MSELTPEIAADVVAACQAGAEEAASALSRALDSEFALSSGEAGSYATDTAPEGFVGAGFVVLLQFGEVGMAAVLPESSGLLPDWYANPDPTGESKLSTLAQELGRLLVPETLNADAFEAARVEKLSEAITAAGVAEGAALVPLELSAGEISAQLSLIWPLSSPNQLFPASDEATEEESSSEKAPAEAPPADSNVGGPASNPELSGPQDFSQLPSYSKSLLKIQVPVKVVLASKKESVRDVIELAPGSIITFEKSCDEFLQLFVNDQEVAQGEAVKVGEYFGFRISSMSMPDEHFVKAQAQRAG